MNASLGCPQHHRVTLCPYGVGGQVTTGNRTFSSTSDAGKSASSRQRMNGSPAAALARQRTSIFLRAKSENRINRAPGPAPLPGTHSRGIEVADHHQRSADFASARLNSNWNNMGFATAAARFRPVVLSTSEAIPPRSASSPTATLSFSSRILGGGT